METAWQYRVGSGIVWDSGAKSEWEECRTKCDFLLLHRDRPFEILESLFFDKRFVFLKEHAARMKKTALRFGYDFDGAALRALLEKTSRSLRGPHKVRILLNARGGFRSDAAPLRHEKDPDMLFISKTPVDPDNIFLYHKTTRREWYDAAIKNVNKGLCYDVAFFNKQGQVTEGARTNLFARIKGRLYTPPVECGLLPGVLRQRLLATGKCAEKILTLKDLKEADAVYAGNSVRGLKKVTVAL